MREMKRSFTKKLFSVMLSLLLVMTLFGCQSSDSAVSYKAGTYEATVAGHNGDLTVEVVVSDTEILEVNILNHMESPSISDAAIERIPVAIVDSQSLAVDTISGATVSSKAIINGVTEALKKAGADIDKLLVKNDKEAVKGETKEYTADVVIIGGGGAGLAAAVSAHQNGATVIVVEKMSRLGGNTILSGGALNAVDPVRQEAQGIEDSVEKHYTQTYEGGDKLGNPVLIRTLVENAYAGVQWLEELGMTFKDEVFTVLGGMWPRAHKPTTPLGTGFISTYQNYIDNNEGIEVLLDTEALELVFEEDRKSVV